MKKGIIALAGSSAIAVAILGAIIWNAHDSSHSMVIQTDTLSSLIDYQRQNSIYETPGVHQANRQNVEPSYVSSPVSSQDISRFDSVR